MKGLSVVDGLEFPIEAVTQKLAWIGRTGSGKTYGLKRFVEQMLYRNVQVVVIDTVGVWNGLRLGAKGFAIPVLGGLYGDIELEPSAGALVADMVIEHATSIVLDTSQMTDGQRAKFCETFGRQLFMRKKSAPSAMHIVLDEGQDIVPQNPNEGEKMMLHEWVRINKQGRAFGIGTSISTQRPQEVNKKALNQVECVMAFQLTGPQERKALEYWMSDRGVDTRLSTLLPTLEVGEPFVWSPQWLKVSQKARVLPIDSEDTSRTPTVGEKRSPERAMRQIDLSKLQASMAAMVTEAKAKDPVALRERLRALEAQLAAGGAIPGDLDMMLRVIIHENNERAQLSAEHVANLLSSITGSFEQLALAIEEIFERDRLHQKRLREQLEQVDFYLRNPTPAAAAPAQATTKPPTTTAAPVTAKHRSTKQEALFHELPSGAQEVLKAAYQYGARGVPTAAIHLMTGHSARTVQNYISLLVTTGPLLKREGDRVSCTELGNSCVPSDVEKLPTGMAIVEHLGRVLPASLHGVLKAIAAQHPRPCTAESVSKRLGISERTATNYLSELSTRDIIVRSKGQVKLSTMITGDAE